MHKQRENVRDRNPIVLKIGKQKVAKTPRERIWWNPYALSLFLLACVFLLASAEILLRFGEFEQVLTLSDIIPNVVVSAVGIVITVLVTITGLCLLFPILRERAVRMAQMEGCLFLSYAIWEWVNAVPRPANGFGAIFNLFPWQTILINLFVISLSMLSILRYGNQSSVKGEMK